MDARDLDMDGVLIGWQRRQVSASLVAEIAARAHEPGPATAWLAGMVGRPRSEIEARLAVTLPELLSENGGEDLADEEAVRRTILRVARRIVAGEIRPGIGAMTIAELGKPWSPHWSIARPFHA